MSNWGGKGVKVMATMGEGREVKAMIQEHIRRLGIGRFI